MIDFKTSSHLLEILTVWLCFKSYNILYELTWVLKKTFSWYVSVATLNGLKSDYKRQLLLLFELINNFVHLSHTAVYIPSLCSIQLSRNCIISSHVSVEATVLQRHSATDRSQSCATCYKWLRTSLWNCMLQVAVNMLKHSSVLLRTDYIMKLETEIRISISYVNIC